MSKRVIFSYTHEGQVVTFYMQNADEHTNRNLLEIVTETTDTYGGKKTDPRSVRLYMSDVELGALATALQHKCKVDIMVI